MIRVTKEKRSGIALLPSASYYKMRYPRRTHVLAFSLFRTVIYFWYAKTPKNIKDTL